MRIVGQGYASNRNYGLKIESPGSVGDLDSAAISAYANGQLNVASNIAVRSTETVGAATQTVGSGLWDATSGYLYLDSDVSTVYTLEVCSAGIAGAADTWDWSNNGSPPLCAGTHLRAMSTSPETMDRGIQVTWGSTTGHTVGDQGTITVVVTYCHQYAGTGSPNGVLTGNICDSYEQSDGSTSGTLWLKQSGSSSVGWNVVPTGSGGSIGGSIANTQVAVGAPVEPDTIAGSSALTFASSILGVTGAVTASGAVTTPDIILTEIAAPSPVAGNGVIYEDSTTHQALLSRNNAAFLPLMQVSGAITPGDCAKFADAVTVTDFGGTCAPGSVLFSAIGTGVNTGATMTVGTAASLGVFNGSGTINATSLNGATFAAPGAIGGGTASTGAFTTITGALTGNVTGNVSGTAASFTGNLTGDTTSVAMATTTVKINGTTVPVNSSADQFLRTTGSAIAGWATMPDCQDSAGNHVNYTASTHTLSCGTSASGAGTHLIQFAHRLDKHHGCNDYWNWSVSHRIGYGHE